MQVHGHLPQQHGVGNLLARWLQREMKKLDRRGSSFLTEEQMQKLKKLRSDFPSTRVLRWMDSFSSVVEYAKNTGFIKLFIIHSLIIL